MILLNNAQWMSFIFRRYGSRPCSLCSLLIGPNEQVMRVSPNYVYHLHCFTCIKCHARLVKGDRYVSFNGQLFCEKDNPLKTTSNSPASKRGAQTSKRGAKAAAASRAAAAAAAAAQSQQGTYLNPSTPLHQTQYPHATHSGHISLLNNQHLHGQSPSNTITHSLLNNPNNHHMSSTTTTTNGSSSLGTGNPDEMF